MSKGQIGYTSQSHIFKSRFNYGWDWVVRLVPLGIWDRLYLRRVGPARLHGCLPDARYDAATGQGSLSFRLDVEAPNTAAMACHVAVRRRARPTRPVRRDPALRLCAWPRRDPDRPGPTSCPLRPGGPMAWASKSCTTSRWISRRSAARCSMAGSGRVGFKQVRWLPNQGSPANAEPWICEVNGTPVFLQGVNWVPPRITYGSVTREQYAERLALYADMGCNILRVWGGSVPEKKEFYDLCDELGLMVWQEFPLSSSGADNYPPEDPQVLADLTAIAASYIWRRGGHVSHLIWCGGNELTERDGAQHARSTHAHPAIAALGAVVARLDPGKRFVATSPSGPSFSMNPSLRRLGHAPRRPRPLGYPGHPPGLEGPLELPRRAVRLRGGRARLLPRWTSSNATPAAWTCGRPRSITPPGAIARPGGCSGTISRRPHGFAADEDELDALRAGQPAGAGRGPGLHGSPLQATLPPLRRRDPVDGPRLLSLPHEHGHRRFLGAVQTRGAGPEERSFVARGTPDEHLSRAELPGRCL